MAITAASVIRGPGEMAAMVVQVTKIIFTRPFQFREFIEQAWFITSVTLMPTILVSIPFGAVISLQVGNLTGQLGAQSFAGATAVLAVVREAAPIAAALIIAGAAGSAICSDMGARKIREEIDAMEVLGVDPLERLVAPRVVATTFVALMINGIVISAGIGGGYFFTVIVQGGSAGAFLSSFTALATLPGPLHRDGQGGRLRLAGRDRRRLQGPQRRRRTERRRPRGQRGRDRGVHAAVLPQRDHHRHLLPSHPTPGALMANISSRSRSGHRARRAAPSRGTATSCCSTSRRCCWVPRAIKRYPREITNTLAEVTFGAGGLTLIAGTVGVIAFLAFFAGTEVGIQGYASLSQLGVAKFSAFISAYFNTREVAPLVSAIALAATVGCGYTARLGAMRISEEIDALEVMGIPSLPFLVTTRMIAAFVAVIPLYVVALCASYLSPRLIVTLIYGQSPGTYDHYFIQFLPPIDMLWSFGKLLFLAAAVILIHCYYGYTASGGPAGVGQAVGRAIRTSIVTIVVADFFLSFAIWGSTTTVRITG